MHWSQKLAKTVVDRSPNKEKYVCAAGISPSGSIHIGNFRDVATSYFVCRGLQKMGKNVTLLFSWDDFDRLRKIPVNVKALKPEDETFMDEYIGKPYVDVPDPYGCCESWAKHFELEFEKALNAFGIDVSFRYQSKEYRSGRYKDDLIHALKNRKQIFDIIDSFRTQDAQEGERDAYFPVSIYCGKCGKDTTKIESLDDESMVATYNCACGNHQTFDFNTDFNCKLAWKIDWPMRWKAEEVDFEPGGKDHSAPTSSYQTSRIISSKIYGFEAPLFQGYEFIGIKGSAGKMSGSTGLNLTPQTLLKIYTPEVILWLYSKTEPTKAFNFCFDDEILRQYFEYDKMYADWQKNPQDEHLDGIMYNTTVKDSVVETVPMGALVNFGSIVDFNIPMLETIFEKMGTPYKENEFTQRLVLAKNWLEQCSPQSMNKIVTKRNWKYYDTMTQEEKQMITILADYLKNNEYDLDALNKYLYSVPTTVYGELDPKQKKTVQGKFFKDVYNLTIGKDRGPRLYLFLYAVGAENYVDMLDFSGEREVEEVIEAPQEVVAEQEVEEVEPIKDIKEEITFDVFEKIDLRVCKVVDCQAVKKSRSLLKLTLFDGIAERTIVSGIKDYYTPEELVGKKIVVVANLKPVKLAGVVSEGMLLAGSASKSVCKVVFVDDCLPEGTRLS